MSSGIFLMLMVFVLPITISIIFNEDLIALFVTAILLSIIIGIAINNNRKPIDYNDVCDRIQVVALTVDDSNELKSEIKKIIDEQVTEDGYLKLEINIEDEEITGGVIKTVNISAKEKVFGKFVYNNSGKTFKMAISDVEGKNVKVIDFRYE